MYGSYMTGTWLPESDIDIFLNDRMYNGYDQQEYFENLDYIFRSKKNVKWVQTPKKGYTNGIKVLVELDSPEPTFQKLTSNKPLFVKFDFRLKEHSNTTNRLENQNYHLRQSPLIRPLFMTLKTIIFKAQLNDSCQGGLNSYSLMNMLLAFIQNQNTRYQYEKQTSILGNKVNNQRLLARLLIDFLSFYGFYF